MPRIQCTHPGCTRQTTNGKCASHAIEYHPCSAPGCDQLTSKDLCRVHAVKYNQCARPGCTLRCRQEYCSVHKPEVMEKRRQYINRRRAAERPQPEPVLIPVIEPTPIPSQDAEVSDEMQLVRDLLAYLTQIGLGELPSHPDDNIASDSD